MRCIRFFTLAPPPRVSACCARPKLYMCHWQVEREVAMVFRAVLQLRAAAMVRLAIEHPHHMFVSPVHHRFTRVASESRVSENL